MSEARAVQAKGGDPIAFITRRADEGDPEALLAVAHWRLWGANGPRDPAATLRLLEQAGERGSDEAVRLRAHLVANGTGMQADFAAGKRLLATIAARDPAAARQIEMIGAMRDLHDLPGEQLREAPEVRLVPGFLERTEADYLIAAAAPVMRPSFIVDPVTGQPRPDPVRTSVGMNFDPLMEDLVVRRINLRIAEVTGTAVEAGEPLHILHYRPGEEFRPHLDAIHGAANQRIMTVLVYLNDDYEGGETRFPDLGLSVRGTLGDALIFSNVDSAGQPAERSGHAGLPVTSGAKWIASRWIRARPYDPFAQVR